MKTLCFDFGNTRLKVAVFEDHQQKDTLVIGADPVQHIRELLDYYQPERSILSSVVDHPEEVETLLQQRTQFHKLSAASKLPFTIPAGKAETVGADRLAIAAASVFLFPNRNNLAIGLGTCITFNFINKFHELIGGSISPGMGMRFKSMHDYTAKLPLVEAEWNVPLIGYDTRTNLQSGVILGMAKEIDGIIELYGEKFTNFNVLLTGGDMAFFGSHLKSKIFADPDLIFKGLYAISQINNA
jgi:type III pantothenate kinase